MQPQTLAEQLFFVTTPIWASDDNGSWSGTGFFVRVHLGAGNEFIVLITNKHVISEPHRMEIGIHMADTTGGWMRGVGHKVNLGVLNPDLIVGHPDDSVDVAALPAGPLLGGTYDGHRPFFRTFGFKDLLLDEHLETLDAIEDVIFVGYPIGIFDTENNTPITRRGIAATPLNLDYRGEPAFLIDAAVHPGSSGSPVILFNSGSYRTREGGLTIGSRFGLLGVLAAVHTDVLVGEFVAMPAEVRPVVEQPVGLGIVYKCRAILETIDALCERAGVKRVDSEDDEDAS